jgi:FlaA1/EpsC-like NDP-sugar epimerase
MTKLREYFREKTILVTGCAGTVGSEIIKQLLLFDDNEIKVIGIDNNESAIFFQDQKYSSNLNARFYVCDVRDANDLEQRFIDVDIVIHCAAMKHVLSSERSPSSTVAVNVTGLQNVIDAARKNCVSKVIFTSSDKAVNPTNVMGTTKLLGERLFTAANLQEGLSSTIFSSTRFGNVIGSNGSVYQIFSNQLRHNLPLTITSRKMTRFVMSIQEAAILVLNSVVVAKGGEVFVTKMPVIEIENLARAMRSLAEKEHLEIIEVGVKPGEKLYEELMTEEEMPRSIELNEYFVILPALTPREDIDVSSYGELISRKIEQPYISSAEYKLTTGEISALLESYQLDHF